MNKKNYQAWNVDPNKFSEGWDDATKLAFFASYGILAPSGHNSQPWLLSKGESSLNLLIHPSRHLSADGSGLLSAEPFISLGTFIEAFCLAAEGFGYSIDVNLFPTKRYTATLTIRGRVDPKPELLTAIVSRVSNRNSFKKTPIGPSLLSEITSHSFKELTVKTVTRRGDIEFVARETKTGIESIMSHKVYREELSKWVRINQTHKFDGMPGFTHGFGDIKSLISRIAVRHAPKHGPEAEKSAKLIHDSGALIIVSCDIENPESFVNAGRIFSRVCTLAYNSGLAASALGASVLDPNSRESIKKRFDIKGRPLYLLRVGVPTVKSPHSPRWPIDKIFSQEDA